MNRAETQKLPSFVESLYMVALTLVIQPSVPEISSIIDSQELRVTMFLHQCQKIYDRNMVKKSDRLIVETKDDFLFMFHESHVCLHIGPAKVAQFPTPLGANASDVAREYLRLSRIKQNK